jgi:hypothetical protein
MIKDFNEDALFAGGINETSLALEDLDIGAKYYWTVIPFNGIVYGGCVDGIFSFEINNPPTLLDIPSQKIIVEKEFVLDVNANDIDPQDENNLVYSLSSEPSGMSIDPSTGTIRWTPYKDQLGRHNVRILVSDGFDETSQRFTIEVIKNDAESKPEETNFELYSILAIVIVVIVIILILFMWLRRKKKGDKDLESDPNQSPQPMLENQIPLGPQIEGQYPQTLAAPMMEFQEQQQQLLMHDPNGSIFDQQMAQEQFQPQDQIISQPEQTQSVQSPTIDQQSPQSQGNIETEPTAQGSEPAIPEGIPEKLGQESTRTNLQKEVNV